MQETMQSCARTNSSVKSVCIHPHTNHTLVTLTQPFRQRPTLTWFCQVLVASYQLAG